MVIIMFTPTNGLFPNYDRFLSALDKFKGNFVVTSTANDRKRLLRTLNTVETDFYRMEDEARKIMDDPKSAKIVRKTYNGKDFWECVKAASAAGVELSIPDDLC
mgnify:CR=1 FL=1